MFRIGFKTPNIVNAKAKIADNQLEIIEKMASAICDEAGNLVNARSDNATGETANAYIYEVYNKNTARVYNINVKTSQSGQRSNIGAVNEYGTGEKSEGFTKAEEIPWVYFDDVERCFRVSYGSKPKRPLRDAIAHIKVDLIKELENVFNGI